MHTLTFEAPGYEPTSVLVRVIRDWTTRVRLHLDPGTLGAGSSGRSISTKQELKGVAPAGEERSGVRRFEQPRVS